MVGEEPLPQDYEEAVKWFRRSANQGFAGSEFKLSAMYWAGKGVKQDAVQAHMWANLAAAQGTEMARGARMIAEEQMTRDRSSKRGKWRVSGSQSRNVDCESLEDLAEAE